MTEQSEAKRPDNSAVAERARQSYFLAALTTAALAVFSLFQDTTQLERALEDVRILQTIESRWDGDYLPDRARDKLNNAMAVSGKTALAGMYEFQGVVEFGQEKCFLTDLDFEEEGEYFIHASAPALAQVEAFGNDSVIGWRGVALDLIDQPRSLSDYRQLWNGLVLINAASVVVDVAPQPLAGVRFMGTSYLVEDDGTWSGSYSRRDGVNSTGFIEAANADRIPDPSQLKGFASFPSIKLIEQVLSDYSDQFRDSLSVETGGETYFLATGRCLSKAIVVGSGEDYFFPEMPITTITELETEFFRTFHMLGLETVQFDPIDELLRVSFGENVPNLARTSFEGAFPSLHNEFQSIASLSLSEIENEITRRLENTGGNIEVVGLSFPASALRAVGIAIILTVQLYFYLHLSALVRRIETNDEAFDVPWIALYNDPVSVWIFRLLAGILPIGTVIVLTLTNSVFSFATPAQFFSMIVNAMGLIGVILVGVAVLIRHRSLTSRRHE